MTKPEHCTGIIDLSKPAGSVRERGFQPPWHTVYLYTCPVCHGTVRVRAGRFVGKRATPERGAITCPRLTYATDLGQSQA